jgi:hypothetical protein
MATILDRMREQEKHRELRAVFRQVDALNRPPTEISRNGRMTRKLVGGPRALTSQMVRMIDLMIRGHDWDPSHTPLDMYAAAAAVGYRRKAARHLVISPLFAEAYWRASEGQSLGPWTPSFEEVRESVQKRDRERAARSLRPGYVIQA